MSRESKLEQLRNHAMFGGYFKKMKKADLDDVFTFVREREHLPDNDFLHEANRFKMDQPKNLKVYSMQWALITQTCDTGSMLRKRRKEME